MSLGSARLAEGRPDFKSSGDFCPRAFDAALFMDSKFRPLFFESFAASVGLDEGIKSIFFGGVSEVLVTSASLANDGASADEGRCRSPMTFHASENSPSSGILGRLKGPHSSSARGFLRPRVTRHGFSIRSAVFGSLFHKSAPSGEKETGCPKP